MTLEERATAEQPDKGEAECDLQTRALAAETLKSVQPHLLVDPPEMKRHAGDLCSGLTIETANAEREVVEAAMRPRATESEPWDLRGPEPAHAEDQKYNSPPSVSLLSHICATGAHDLCRTFKHY